MTADDDQYDADFGYIQFNEIDAWDCNVSAKLPHPPTYYLALHIWSDEGGPTELQRQRVRWLKRDYVRLWPQIAETICRLHPDLTDSSQLTGVMRDYLSVHIGEHSEDSVQLVYDLDLPDEGTRGFFISVTETGVIGAFVAE